MQRTRPGAKNLAASESVLERLEQSTTVQTSHRKPLDKWLLIGLLIAAGAAVAGVASTGVGLNYFLQPAGALIVLGGTLGVTLVATPGFALANSIRRVAELFLTQPMERAALIEEIVVCARESRREGLSAQEERFHKTTNEFLGRSLLLALDVKNRAELETALETELRMTERQAAADAKTLEVAGGFAPTLGILGTVVGLIHVLRQFSSLESVGIGIGTAFVSTLYGLGLANLVLLPAAQRIRARAAATLESQELILDGVLCLVDGIHPSLIRQRLNAFLRRADRPRNAA
jgi:chemotaxis protein MotA